MSQPGAEPVLLTALRGMPFFEQRFLKPICASSSSADAQMALLLFTSALFKHVPDLNKKIEIAQKASHRIVREWTTCPSPADVRRLVGESILQSADLTFQTLFEIAKRFIAFPPRSTSEANEWKYQLAYSAIRSVPREMFHAMDLEQWSEAVTKVVMGDITWKTYLPPDNQSVAQVKRNFSSILLNENHDG